MKSEIIEKYTDGPDMGYGRGHTNIVEYECGCLVSILTATRAQKNIVNHACKQHQPLLDFMFSHFRKTKMRDYDIIRKFYKFLDSDPKNAHKIFVHEREGGTHFIVDNAFNESDTIVTINLGSPSSEGQTAKEVKDE